MKTEIDEKVVETIVKKTKEKITSNSKKIKPEKDSDMVDYFKIIITQEVSNAN